MTDLSTRAEPAVPAAGDDLAHFPRRGGRRPDRRAEVADFYAEESAALDEARYQDWLDLLTGDFRYQVPVPLVREDPALPRHSDRAMLFEATKHIFALKLGRIGLDYAWSDRPSGVMRHFVGGVRVFDVEGVDGLRADCNVLATWSRVRGEAAVVTAGRQDVLVESGPGQFRVRRRRVLLDVEVATYQQLSVIF